MLSMKYFVFKKQPTKKLVDWYVSPYIIDRVVSTNTVTAAHFNENSPSCEHQLNSII